MHNIDTDYCCSNCTPQAIPTPQKLLKDDEAFKNEVLTKTCNLTTEVFCERLLNRSSIGFMPFIQLSLDENCSIVNPSSSYCFGKERNQTKFNSVREWLVFKAAATWDALVLCYNYFSVFFRYFHN